MCKKAYIVRDNIRVEFPLYCMFPSNITTAGKTAQKGVFMASYFVIGGYMLEQSEIYAEIGDKIIKSKLNELQDVTIAYLVSDEEKKKSTKLVLGECVKVAKNYLWVCPYDFMLIFYEQNYPHFTEEQIEILVEHELRHIGIDEAGNATKYYVKPHDIEDFNEIIDNYGIRWDT